MMIINVASFTTTLLACMSEYCLKFEGWIKVYERYNGIQGFELDISLQLSVFILSLDSKV